MKAPSRIPILFLVMAISACSGGGGPGGVVSLENVQQQDEVAAVDPEAQALAFVECMRQNGMEMEDPTVDLEGNVRLGRPSFLGEPPEDGTGPRRGGEMEEMQQAFDACGDLMQGAISGFERPDMTAMQDQMLEFAACLREQGLEVADPDFSGFTTETGVPDTAQGFGRARGMFGLDFEDPGVQEAMETCQEALPNFGGGGMGFGLLGR